MIKNVFIEYHILLIPMKRKKCILLDGTLLTSLI